ncbi:MAG: xanthine dehydrogenase accessory protein XdhC [Rhodobacteraceae bacterium]|nr:xanthine dehydrogenase accessory protein XdhC [Paracoccaceae bacterium]
MPELRQLVRRHGSVARVLVAKASGSVPRKQGTAMAVWKDGQSGTIGGGALEFHATEKARIQLTHGNPAPHLERISLGPNLGQCCGGSVTLLTELFDGESLETLQKHTQDEYCLRPIRAHARDGNAARDKLSISPYEAELAKGWIAEKLAAPRQAVWIYGAGHVGRAIVDLLVPLNRFAIVWIDVGPERFPEISAENVDILPTPDPAQSVMHAPDACDHLVLTYSHAMDLEICNRILSRKFSWAGLIGSATKWARFRRRLIASGYTPDAVDQISCPIGNPRLGKNPHAIAVGVVADLLSRYSD